MLSLPFFFTLISKYKPPEWKSTTKKLKKLSVILRGRLFDDIEKFPGNFISSFPYMVVMCPYMVVSIINFSEVSIVEYWIAEMQKKSVIYLRCRTIAHL